MCLSSKAVESGKFCDNVHRLCAASRLSRRRIDISTCACLFEFDLLENAQAMVNATLPAGLPSFTMRIEKPFYWLVKEVNTQHTGHPQPFRECEKNMYLTYQMKVTAKSMADSNCPLSEIADYLTSRGCSGTLTNHRLKYAVDVCRRDMEDFTVIPKANETDAEALIRVLKEKKCRFIYLYTNPPEDTLPSCMELMTSEMSESIKIVEGQQIQGGIFSGWLSKMAAFFSDAWAMPTPLQEEGPSVGPSRSSDREKTAKWAPAQRFINVQGRKKMLMAILWCTEEELLLAKKFPEVWGHDTKACTDNTGVPWWYTVGFREDLRTFIAMRGHIANETQAMFNFVLHVALLYIHGPEVLKACIAQMGDAKKEFICWLRLRVPLPMHMSSCRHDPDSCQWRRLRWIRN